MSAARYAIYFVPEPGGALYRFGTAAIGYDCVRAADMPFLPELETHESDWSALTREPRTYGFHATLKAPFRLRDNGGEGALVDAFMKFAALPRTPPQFAPQVRLLDRFVALVPDAVSPELTDLADACVIAFDLFRAPLAAQERQRRLQSGLDAEQTANLDRWGYPYVFNQFRFHMTLSGGLPSDRALDIRDRLAGLFTQYCGNARVCVDHLALMRQIGAGERFTMVAHLPLRSI